VLIPAIFLVLILALLCIRVQDALKQILAARPVLIFVVPAFLSALFCAIAAVLGALNLALAALILAYTFIPCLCAFFTRSIDFVIILLLWLPLEFSVGRWWTPRVVQPQLHIAAYGVSILLALAIFLLFRRLDGMKYNLPRTWLDLRNLLLGFAVCAAVLIPVGRAIGFLEPFHIPIRWSPLEFLAILAGTALPEEILFRALIQNLLMRRWGANAGTLFVSALIFGCAHLDNGPGPGLNWRYMIVATLAGLAYGKVFEKSSSIFASAGLHALVNTVKHAVF
jgi:CAAX protease family protein